MFTVLLASGVAAVAAQKTFVPNMNGEYALSRTPGATGDFSTNYSDYPGGAEYFEVYSPAISTLYSQVFWTTLPNVPLPKDIVERFDGKGMAIIGFELDQVLPGKTPDQDVSFGYNRAYNHHFESSMLGKHSRLVKVTDPSDPRLSHNGHGHPEDMYVVEDLMPESSLPTSQAFGAANGGEVRGSWHGYGPGFAQVILSPTELSVTPMQVDTWNRDKMNLTGNGPFVAGPEPRNSLAPPNAVYSGLLECPLTTRIKKLVEGDYNLDVSGSVCPSGIAGAEECFAAASKVLPATTNFTTAIVSDATHPAGCSAGYSAGKLQVLFNTGKSSAQCGAGMRVLSGSTQSLVHLTVSLDIARQQANLTVSGPDGSWFGVGFNASQMKDAPWAIVVDGSGKVAEYKLSDQGQSNKLLQPSVATVSSTVAGGVRTVVVTRPLKGAGPDYFTFNPSLDTVIPFINALGSTPTLSYHKAKTMSSVLLLPEVGSACICAHEPAPFGQGKGALQYEGKTTVGFSNHCPEQPRGDLLAQKNPTCDVRTYTGGQTACHHMWSLLDADQDIPWQDQPLVYHMKFRFWFQEYDPKKHMNVERTTWGIASPVEYDIPKCTAPGDGCWYDTEKSNWIHNITGLWNAGGPGGKNGAVTRHLVAAHYHCHAPACLSVAIYNNDTGKLICEEKPLYGGTGQIHDPRMDQPGFIAQPPCIWSTDPTTGLEAPPAVGGANLYAVKTSNATNGHHGEMAWLQVFYADY